MADKMVDKLADMRVGLKVLLLVASTVEKMVGL